MNPLMDLDFLRQLDLQKNKTVYAKVILLTFNDEAPIEEIQGKITSGSINVDGASAVRRTCSLSMITLDKNINDIYWVLNNKFKLEVGIENHIDKRYPEIIWFKQGTYVFTSINMNVQSNNYTINLSGKDKMCLLNGEVGGSINASIDFGTIEEYETLDNGEIISKITHIPIVEIIKNAVHVYGGEPLHNIVINDVDNYGLELLEYRGDESKPMYMLRHTETQTIDNMTFNGKQKKYLIEKNADNPNAIRISLEEINPKFDLVSHTNENPQVVYVEIKDKEGKVVGYNSYNAIQLDYGDTVGYRKTDLTYPGDLIANVGESLVSVLDKIKSTFSNFEYFYDIDGRFIFQKKKTYINESWNNLEVSEKEIYAQDSMYTSSTTYSFEDGVLLTAFNNNPNISNIKNDFSIWGKRKGITGTELPIHMRYAIHFKPKFYKNQENKIFISKEYDEEIDDNMIEVDWRELIYQMAIDYFKYNHKVDNFTQLIAAANPEQYPNGITGYEEFYTDMQAFWRELYQPGIGNYNLFSNAEKRQAIRQILIDEGQKANEISDELVNQKLEDESYRQKIIDYYKLSYEDSGEDKYFNEKVSNYPETLNFWFDFMSVDGEMAKYSISTIGNRSKAINNDKVRAIYYKDTPQVLFLTQSDYQDLITNMREYDNMTGYSFIRITEQMENYFSISTQGISAQDELNSLLYTHTCANESITLTSMPIYHLQPNTRIFVKDNETGINGEYIVSKVTIPLTYNGTTSITATKAVDRIY